MIAIGSIIFSALVVSSNPSNESACLHAQAMFGDENSNIKTFAANYLPEIRQNLNLAHLPASLLRDSMEHTVLAESKLLRPLLTLVGAHIFKLPKKNIFALAKAVQFGHDASLIFDDLPAQDDAKWRREKKTNHLVFKEGVSQNAGAALIAESFTTVQELAEYFDPELVVKVTKYIGRSIGAAGVALGQVLDLNVDNDSYTLDKIYKISELKTGNGLAVALVPVAILARAEDSEIRILETYAIKLGVLFQITDDLNDVLQPESVTGKDSNLDKKNGTQSFVHHLGVDATRALSQKTYEECIQILATSKLDTRLLADLSRYVLVRVK